jgi:hypothetical protein
MTRSRLGQRDRVRVELRLPRAVAEATYGCARDWNMSLSEAGSRLIEAGLMRQGAHVKGTCRVDDSSTFSDPESPSRPLKVDGGDSREE